MMAKWLNSNGGSWQTDTSMNSKVVMTFSDVQSLATSIYNLSVSSLVFGDFTKWCSSLMYYPLILNSNTEVYYKLSAGGVSYKTINVRGLIPTAAYNGYLIAKWKEGTAENFTDFEPYTISELFLPYYGFVPIKGKDINNMYVYVFLFVDWNTGMSQYVVATSTVSITFESAPYVTGADISTCRIIGTYNFQLGTQVPIESSNFNEIVRNTVLSLGKAAISIGTSMYIDSIPESTTTKTKEVTTQTERNQKTGRQITKGKTTVEGERTTTKQSRPYTPVNTAVETASSVLGNLAMTTTGVASANATLNNNLSTQVCLVKRKVLKAIETYAETAGAEYRHLNGLPLCRTGLLSNYSGYTEITDIHLLGEGFACATDGEMSEIMKELMNGFIL